MLGGCAALQPAPAQRVFVLEYPPPPVAARRIDAVLRVVPFGSDAVYDRQGFVYREGPYEIAIDSYNLWVAAPASLITDLVARDLAAAGRFTAVLSAPSALAAQYELSAQVEVFEERAEDSCSARAGLRALLIQSPARAARRVVFEETFTAAEPCDGSGADAFAAAMSRAVQRVSMALEERIGAVAGGE
ncbi:MAG: ABC-type transport auxiliary lipoprotein family protein [Candidatus Binatia bacterium]